MEDKDIRWKERFFNFKKALQHLEKAENIAQSKELFELEKQGVIQAFEFTHEQMENANRKPNVHYNY